MTDYNATTELTAAGEGLAGFLGAITGPLAAFLMAIGVVTMILFILRKLGVRIGKAI